MKAKRVTYNRDGKQIKSEELKYAYFAFNDLDPKFVITLSTKGGGWVGIEMSPADLLAELAKGFPQ